MKNQVLAKKKWTIEDKIRNKFKSIFDFSFCFFNSEDEEKRSGGGLSGQWPRMDNEEDEERNTKKRKSHRK